MFLDGETFCGDTGHVCGRASFVHCQTTCFTQLGCPPATCSDVEGTSVVTTPCTCGGEVCTGVRDKCDEDGDPKCIPPAPGTLLGSFQVTNGPSWNNAPCASCVEACAIVLGGSADQYSASTSPSAVNYQRHYAEYGASCETGLADNERCDGQFSSGDKLAHVSDSSCAGRTNYCFSSSDTAKATADSTTRTSTTRVPTATEPPTPAPAPPPIATGNDGAAVDATTPRRRVAPTLIIVMSAVVMERVLLQ